LLSTQIGMSITILSGTVGAGKTTVARELRGLLPPPLSYIEGDKFWTFVEKAHSPDQREVFQVIMRATTAAIPLRFPTTIRRYPPSPSSSMKA